MKIGADAPAADDIRESDASTLIMPGVATAASRTSEKEKKKEDRPFDVVNSIRDTPRTISIGINAGGWNQFGSYVSLDTHSRLSPDPAIVAYAVFKEALLALAESFEATTCRAYRGDMLDMLDNSEKFRSGWMVYLAPVCARLVAPPQSAIVEHRPDGGLLMAATRETFVTTNPQHMAVVHDIARAMAPLNALPWPLDGSQV